MKIAKTKLEGVYLIDPNIFEDDRGTFIKTFHKEVFLELGLECQFNESFYSESKKGVIRGMHFQNPPCDPVKLVYVTSGKIIDVVLDIRKGSKTYGEFVSAELSSENKKMFYIPKGFAHGYASLCEKSVVVYLQSEVYSPQHDAGIRYDSFKMKWGIKEPIVSNRDKAFLAFDQFESPFVAGGK